MTNSIYILRCPITNFVRYVGISNNPTRRMYEHKRLETNRHKFNWFELIKSKGLKPKIEILEKKLTREDAAKKEIKYISLFKALGYNLLNITAGGETPPSQLGRRQSAQTLRKRFENSPLRKAVIQKTKDGVFINEFSGVREAYRITGIDHRSIAEVANRSNPKRHSAGGFKWEYKIVK